MPQREIPWFKISVAANVVLVLGLLISLFTRPAASQEPKDAIQAMSDKSSEEALGLAASELANAEQATREWRQFLAEQYLKAGKKEQARAHYSWLVKNFPKEAGYRKGLAAASAKGGKKPGKKK